MPHPTDIFLHPAPSDAAFLHYYEWAHARMHHLGVTTRAGGQERTAVVKATAGAWWGPGPRKHHVAETK